MVEVQGQCRATHVRKYITKKILIGALAQMGEHLLCKQGVIGSIPIRSTNYSYKEGLLLNKHADTYG